MTVIVVSAIFLLLPNKQWCFHYHHEADFQCYLWSYCMCILCMKQESVAVTSSGGFPPSSLGANVRNPSTNARMLAARDTERAVSSTYQPVSQTGSQVWSSSHTR